MNDKDVLDILSSKSLHVHWLDDREILPGYPLALQTGCTHYIMHGEKIVFCGKLKAIPHFARSFQRSPKQNEQN